MTTITPGAVLPVAGPHDTSPAYSGTFIPSIWSSKLNVKFYAATTFGDISNTNWEGEIKEMGDKVVINNIPTITIRPYTVGQSLTYEVPPPETLELVIDKAFYFGVAVADVLEYQAKPKLMDMFTGDASNQMKISIDTECFLATFSGAAAANVSATPTVSVPSAPAGSTATGAPRSGAASAPRTGATGNVSRESLR